MHTRQDHKSCSSHRLPAAATALVAAMAGAAALAEDDLRRPTWMPGDAIRAEFSGKPIAGIYPDERTWTEAIAEDGSTDYREGRKHWLGKWWIRDREFCFSYPPPGLGGCFRVVQISANCFELYDFSGDLGNREDPPFVGDLWNGRMWREDRPATCQSRPSV